MARWTGVGEKPTHCIHGHEFTEENTWIHVNKMGSTLRECRICRRWAQKKRRVYGKKKTLILSISVPLLSISIPVESNEE